MVSKLLLHFHPGIVKAHEPMGVQAFSTELAFEGLNELKLLYLYGQAFQQEPKYNLSRISRLFVMSNGPIVSIHRPFSLPAFVVHLGIVVLVQHLGKRARDPPHGSVRSH